MLKCPFTAKCNSNNGLACESCKVNRQLKGVSEAKLATKNKKKGGNRGRHGKEA